MTPRSRFLNALTGAPTDRVPLLLDGFETADPAAIADPARRKIAERIAPETVFFHSVPSFINRYFITPPRRIRVVDRKSENGNEIVVKTIDTPKGNLTAITGRNPTTRTEWTIRYPVESIADIEKIRSIPWEPPAELKAPELSNLPSSFAERGIVRTGVSSPFVCVAGMMAYEYFLELCATDLSLIAELTSECLRRTLAVLDVLFAKRGIEYLWMGGCEWLTPPMGSPALYDALVQEQERAVIERTHRGGAVVHVHCHGNVRSTIEKVIARGGDFFEPVEPPPNGDITFAEAKRIVDGRITLGGNIEARIIEHGTPAEIDSALAAAYEGGTERMILKPSAGPIGAITPVMEQNLYRIIEFWERSS